MSTTLKVVGIGCIGFIVLAVGCGVIVTLNFKKCAAEGVKRAIVAGIEQTEMDPGQKSTIIARVEQLTEQFKDGDITFEQLGRIGETCECLADPSAIEIESLVYVRGWPKYHSFQRFFVLLDRGTSFRTAGSGLCTTWHMF